MSVKVLVVFSTKFISHGGLTTVMMNYYRSMDRTGIRMDFAGTNEPDEALRREVEAQGSRYVRLPSRKKHPIAYFNALRKAGKGYDIVHVNGNSASSVLDLGAAWAAGVKIRMVQNHNSQSGYPLLNKILKPLCKRSYTKALACSNAAGEWLFGKGGFSLLRNAIDLERYKFDETARKATRAALGIGEKDFVIGHVGRFMPVKNHDLIVKIFGQTAQDMPNAKLLLVGEGVLWQDVAQKVGAMGLAERVVMPGKREDVPAILGAMDVFLFPSIHEGLPLSALEAQAAGLPCVFSDAIDAEVGMGEAVQFVSLDAPVETWAACIKAQENAPLQRQERGMRNHERMTAAGYNIAHEAERLRKLYLQEQ